MAPTIVYGVLFLDITMTSKLNQPQINTFYALADDNGMGSYASVWNSNFSTWDFIIGNLCIYIMFGGR